MSGPAAVATAQAPSAPLAGPAVPPVSRRRFSIGWSWTGPLVLLVAVGGFAFAAMALVDPHVPLAIINENLDGIISGVATGIAGMIAILQWNRYRDNGRPSHLLLASALLVLATENAFSLVVAGANLEVELGFAIEAPGQAPIYGWLFSRVLAAGLFGLAALAELHAWPRLPPNAGVFPVVLAAAVVLAFPILGSLEPLPMLFDVNDLGRFLVPEGQQGVPAGMTAVLTVSSVVIAAVLLAAAIGHRLVYRRTDQRSSLLLAHALIIGALAQLQFAIVPPSYIGLVSAGDVLRLAFYGALALVFSADVLSTLRELRASRELAESLKEYETTQAILAERSRLARDLHDGLAQELWLAKLRLGELLNAAGHERTPAERSAARALTEAIGSAIAEARLAVIAMNVAPGEGLNLESALARYVREVSDKLDMVVTFRADGSVPPLDARASEEILRAVHEALHNVRKHAEASLATVTLDADERQVRIVVSDNGRGLEAGYQARGFGLTGMRQRLKAMGGSVRIESRGQGTRVTLQVPTHRPARVGQPETFR